MIFLAALETCPLRTGRTTERQLLAVQKRRRRIIFVAGLEAFVAAEKASPKTGQGLASAA